MKNDQSKTKIFVPKMARARKVNLDKTLLEAKKTITDLRYIIRNGRQDLQVLMRRGVHGKYMEYPIAKLGSIAPLSPTQKNQIPSSPSKFDTDSEGFMRVPPSKQSIYRQEAVDKDMVTRRIIAFVDGFPAPQEQ